MNTENQHESEKEQISLSKAIQALPVMEAEPYMSMQVLNLEVVDSYLVDMERQLLREYLKKDRLPLPDALLVSALSQMWIFAVYELLRTWRHRCTEVLQFAEELSNLKGSKRESHIAKKQKKLKEVSPYFDDFSPPFSTTYERVANDDNYVKSVRNAMNSTLRPYRKIEALRIHLAKHEMPKARGSSSLSPGYDRIDMVTGSMYWQVSLRGNEVDVISRREVAGLCRGLLEDRSQYMLPLDMQKKISNIPKLFYGVKRISVKLSDNSEYHNVIVLWNIEVTSVANYENIPFDVSKIVDVSEETESLE
ncbi:hypothetical protein ACFL6P_05755 [Candidatus Latescibacterota bacterium]